MITDASPARVMVAVLRALSLGTASGDWKATYGIMPGEDPVRRIGVLSTSPLVHSRDPDGDLSQHYGVQLTVRATTIEEGFTKAQQVIARLLQIIPTAAVQVTVGTVDYKVKAVNLASGPVYVGTNEDKDAALHTVNLLFVAEPV